MVGHYRRSCERKEPKSQPGQVCAEPIDSVEFIHLLPTLLALDSYPFTKLRLAAGEVPRWKAHNPTFHRGTSYGIVLSERALYLYAPFWLSLARWRRIPLNEIQSIEFMDSRWCPRLIVKMRHGREVLRTPLDDRDEMDYDRENLRNAVANVTAQLAEVLPVTQEGTSR